MHHTLRTIAHLSATLGLMLGAAGLTGCALPYSMYEDQRAVGTIMDDKSISTDIKTRLMGEHVGQGWDIGVYCYGGKVFLVGTASPQFREQAENIARDVKGVQSVTSHWFSNKADGINDTSLELSISTALIAAKGVSSTRVNLAVHGGEVVVLGLVPSREDEQRTLQVVRDVKGVKSVVSYVMVSGQTQ